MEERLVAVLDCVGHRGDVASDAVQFFAVAFDLDDGLIEIGLNLSHTRKADIQFLRVVQCGFQCHGAEVWNI
jgi:hypothetical protein